MRKRMNIYITTGRNNLKYAYVAIKSLFLNNQAHEIFLYVVSEDLTLEDMGQELALAKEYGHHIIILRFDEEIAGKYIHIDSSYHWPIGTMSSYWLFHELLPEDVDRIMVIESDTVIVGDLQEIYETDFEDNYVICPGPEHKPENHRSFMRRIGGECLTFVLSMYNVTKIRQDFSLQDILDTDEEIKKLAGYSQMEFTFGMLFKGHIKYVPGRISCIDENERYMEELGYDYITECEKIVKIIHFSSYSDYGKPWNPVSLMPGYLIWWEYAKGSPYYKEYFESQWERYDKTRKEGKRLEKNISYRNLLACAMIITFFAFLCYFIGCGDFLKGMAVTVGAFSLGILGAACLRKISMWMQSKNKGRKQ